MAPLHKYPSTQTLQPSKNHNRSKNDLKMVRLLSFLKVFTAVTLMFMFFQTGSCREVIVRSLKSVDQFATTSDFHQFQESGDIRVLDYDDTGPNTNDRGFTQPLPSQEPPESRD